MQHDKENEIVKVSFEFALMVVEFCEVRVLCPENKLNYNGSNFFKDQGEKRSRTGGSASIFNDEIWKKNNILLSSFSGQSTKSE
jgi:hypothetical protein